MTPFSPTYNLVTEGRLIYKGLNSRTLTEMKGMRSSGSLDDDFLPEWLGIDPNCQVSQAIKDVKTYQMKQDLTDGKTQL